MIKTKRGERHPIFNLDYLAENIASLVETIVLSVETLLMILFSLNFVTDFFGTNVLGVNPNSILDQITVWVFVPFKFRNSPENNLIALLIVVLSYFLSHIYFEYVKYNLHPKVKHHHKPKEKGANIPLGTNQTGHQA